MDSLHEQCWEANSSNLGQLLDNPDAELVVVIGDSTNLGAGTLKYNQGFAGSLSSSIFSDKIVLNLARFGATFNLLLKMEERLNNVLACLPEGSNPALTIIVNIGGNNIRNDALSRATNLQEVKIFEEVLKRLAQKGEVYVAEAPAINSYTDEINAAIPDLCNRFGPYKADKSLMAPDGYHPNLLNDLYMCLSFAKSYYGNTRLRIVDNTILVSKFNLVFKYCQEKEIGDQEFGGCLRELSELLNNPSSDNQKVLDVFEGLLDSVNVQLSSNKYGESQSLWVGVIRTIQARQEGKGWLVSSSGKLPRSVSSAAFAAKNLATKVSTARGGTHSVNTAK